MGAADLAYKADHAVDLETGADWVRSLPSSLLRHRVPPQDKDQEREGYSIPAQQALLRERKVQFVLAGLKRAYEPARLRTASRTLELSNKAYSLYVRQNPAEHRNC